MSPRRTYPKKRRAPAEKDERPLSAGLTVAAPLGWEARVVTKERALKEYRCPGCDHEIRVGVEHVVAWREGGDAHRRHWHSNCWRTARL